MGEEEGERDRDQARASAWPPSSLKFFHNSVYLTCAHFAHSPHDYENPCLTVCSHCWMKYRDEKRPLRSAISMQSNSSIQMPHNFQSRMPGGSLLSLRLNPLRFLRRLALDHGDV